jgi:lipoyl(octanoyl) transferase
VAETRTLAWSYLGRVGYAAATSLQGTVREALRRGEGPERLLLLEHPPVFTLGRNADAREVLWSESELAEHGLTVHETDRGGQVTYHGPGQLVGYPILDLHPDRRDLRRYVRDLSRALVDTLAAYGVPAEAGEGPRIGVWTGGRKIVSIGIHLSRWITTHGFAMNVDPDLSHFRGIVACGMPDAPVTSIARETGRRPELVEVARRAAGELAAVFERELVEDPELARAVADVDPAVVSTGAS